MSVLPLHEPNAIATAWRRQVAAGWGPTGQALDAADARVLVDAVLDADDDLAPLLQGLGKRCAREGTPLEEVASWVTDLLAVLPSSARRHLDRLDVALALAEGWAEGTMERRLPPRNGMTSMPVLHERLRQLYDECEAMHLDPSSLYGVAVFDAELAHLGPHAAHAARTVMAEAVLRTFHSGETVAAGDGGRVLVLTGRSMALAEQVVTAVQRCEQSPVLVGTWVTGWVEPVARDRRHAPAHLEDLARRGR